MGVAFLLLLICGRTEAQWTVKWKPPGTVHPPHPPHPIIPHPPVHPIPHNPIPPNPIEMIKKAIKETQDELKNVQAKLVDVRSNIQAQQKQLDLLDSNASQLTKQLADSTQRYSTALNNAAFIEGKVNQARGELQRLSSLRDVAIKEQQRLDQQLMSARGKLQTAVAQLLDTKLLAYDLTTTGVLSYNISTGSFYASIDLPGGAKLDNDKVKEWMKGQFSLPEFNPVEMAFYAVGVEITQSSGYNARRKELIDGNPGASVYLASQRFVDWFSPETVGRIALLMYGSGGTASESVINEFVTELQSEFYNLVAWAKLNGIEEIDAFADAALTALITRTGFEVGEVKLDMNWSSIDYTYQAHLSGLTELPMKLLPGGSRVEEQSQSVLGKMIPDSPHMSYDLVFKGKQGELKTTVQRLIEAKSGEMAEECRRLLGRSIGRVKEIPAPVRDFLLKATEIQQLDPITEKTKALFGIDRDSLLKAAEQGNWVLDLRATEVGQKLKTDLNRLACGNDKSSEFKVLELDLSSGRIHCEFLLRHRQSWGTVKEAFEAVNRWCKEKGRTSEIESDQFLGSLDTQTTKEMQRTWKQATDDTRAAERSLSQGVAKVNSLLDEVGTASKAVDEVAKQLQEAIQIRDITQAAQKQADMLLANAQKQIKSVNDGLVGLKEQERALESREKDIEDLIKKLVAKLH